MFRETHPLRPHPTTRLQRFRNDSLSFVEWFRDLWRSGGRRDRGVATSRGAKAGVGSAKYPFLVVVVKPGNAFPTTTDVPATSIGSTIRKRGKNEK